MRLQIQREGITSEIGEWDYHEENETGGKIGWQINSSRQLKRDSKQFQGIVQIIER